MFPENIVQATFQVAQTKYVSQRPQIKPKNLTDDELMMFNNGSMNIIRSTVVHAPGINVMGKSLAPDACRICCDESPWISFS